MDPRQQKQSKILYIFRPSKENTYYLITFLIRQILNGHLVKHSHTVGIISCIENKPVKSMIHKTFLI